MIERVAIKGFKSLADVDVKLEPLSVLFGPNAAGKSNFLDALQLLSRFLTSPTLSEAFEKYFRGKRIEAFTYCRGGLPELKKKGQVRASFEVDLSFSPQTRDRIQQLLEVEKATTAIDYEALHKMGFDFTIRPATLRYAITFVFDWKSGQVSNENESLIVLANGKSILKTHDGTMTTAGKEKKMFVLDDAVTSNYCPYMPYDRTAAGWLQNTLQFPNLRAFKEELSCWHFFQFEPREKMRAAESLKDNYRIGTNGEGLATYLNTLKHKDRSKFETVQRGLHLVIPTIDRIETEVDDNGDIELRIVENGVPVSSRLMSEGTLRILGLLAVCVGRDKPTLVGLEEPENGIPPGRLKLVAEFLKTQTTYNGIQFIVTTHSPLLPDLVPESSLFVCRKQNGATSITPFAKWNGISKSEQIEGDLDDDEPLTPSERILRGDFDAHY